MYRGVMSHDTEEWCKTWRKTNLLFQQWQEFGEFWSEHSKVSKICILIGCFHAKYITFDLKKYRGVIFHDTAELCKIRRNTDLWFGKFGKFGNLANFHQNNWWKVIGKYSKVSKMYTLMGCFWPKYLMF